MLCRMEGVDAPFVSCVLATGREKREKGIWKERRRRKEGDRAIYYGLGRSGAPPPPLLFTCRRLFFPIVLLKLAVAKKRNGWKDEDEEEIIYHAAASPLRRSAASKKRREKHGIQTSELREGDRPVPSLPRRLREPIEGLVGRRGP